MTTSASRSRANSETADIDVRLTFWTPGETPDLLIRSMNPLTVDPFRTPRS